MAGPRRIVEVGSPGFLRRIKDEIVFTTPTFLTSVRVGLTSVLFIILVEGGWGFPLFALACLTDVLDGALARWLHADSKIGGVLDAYADFLLVFSASTFLVWNGLAPFWFLCLITAAFIRFIFREEASRSDPLGKHIGTVLFVALGVVLQFPVFFVATWAITIASCYIITSMTLCLTLSWRFSR